MVEPPSISAFFSLCCLIVVFTNSFFDFGKVLWIMLVPLLLLMLFLTTLAGASNLRTSVRHCYFGTDAEIAARLHQRVDLIDPFAVHKFRSLPPAWERR